MAYVPQEAWVRNRSLRDNILLESRMDESRYADVLESCALVPDIQLLDDGDLTEIGEKVLIRFFRIFMF